jgi:hypothetical protein
MGVTKSHWIRRLLKGLVLALLVAAVLGFIYEEIGGAKTASIDSALDALSILAATV